MRERKPFVERNQNKRFKLPTESDSQCAARFIRENEAKKDDENENELEDEAEAGYENSKQRTEKVSSDFQEIQYDGN